MPRKEEAFDELFERFQRKLKSRLTPEGAEAFIEVFRQTVGHYLDCKKIERDVDYWDVPEFRIWALASADKFAAAVDDETGSASPPAGKDHVNDGALKSFDKIKADPNEYCNKGELPDCDPERRVKVFGPVCDLWYRNRAGRGSAPAAQPD